MATANTTVETVPGRDSPRLKMRKLKGIGLDFTRNDEASQRLSSRIESKLDALLHDSLTVEAVARKLDVKPASVEAWLTAERRTLYGIQHASEWRIPAFQLAGDGLLPGLEQVIPRLHPELHPAAFAQWFQKPNPDLVDVEGAELSPREWLRRGHRPACVATLAAHLDSF